jgi:hypothetical protein
MFLEMHPSKVPFKSIAPPYLSGVTAFRNVMPFSLAVSWKVAQNDLKSGKEINEKVQLSLFHFTCQSKDK